ncbi:NAD(P)H-dependent oxidoreductase [Roseovarius sp. E0-M6]|uniref:NAD(P)H-dependent oxidoreductase n=1 Tax=Roseovarius sp. E0-M6 TaxID=3127118 RepID=UPI00301057FA
MSRKIFIWVAHPKPASLCAALADAYEAGARSEGADIRRLDLADMDFNGSTEVAKHSPLESDLIAWQEALAWCDHVMIVHPYWWGAMPARAKAVLDRALSSGFAFKYHERGMGWDKLLKGRTADALITSDTPPLLDTILYRKPGRRVLRNQVLGFVGIRMRKIVQLGSVKLANPQRLGTWIERAHTMGRKAA